MDQSGRALQNALPLLNVFILFSKFLVKLNQIQLQMVIQTNSSILNVYIWHGWQELQSTGELKCSSVSIVIILEPSSSPKNFNLTLDSTSHHQFNAPAAHVDS